MSTSWWFARMVFTFPNLATRFQVDAQQVVVQRNLIGQFEIPFSHFPPNFFAGKDQPKQAAKVT
jgi:hypothetical protein